MPNIITAGEDIIIRTADFTEMSFTLSFKGTTFTLKGLPQRIYLFYDRLEKPVGCIKKGSACSGAIWVLDACVADFEASSDGTYYVTAVSENFRQPETRSESDPVHFLLDSAYFAVMGKH